MSTQPSISDLVDSFLNSDKPADGFVDDYTRRLLDVWRQHNKRIARYAVVVFASVIVFELLRQAAVGQTGISSAQVTNLCLLLALIPVVSSFSMLRIMTSVVDWSVCADAFTTLTRKRSPKLNELELDQLIAPAGHFMMINAPYSLMTTRTRRIMSVAEVAQGAGITVLPLLAATYEYFRLFGLYGASSIFVWISLGLSIILLVPAYALLVDIALQFRD